MQASATLYRKYRPQKFSDVIGQKHVVTTLTNALRSGRVGQAYLFTGPRGTGKTTLARLFAKAINCSDRDGAEACGKCPHCLLAAEGRSFDIIEIDAASHTGVDNIRELRETIALPPTLGSHKIYIIDEVHMLSIGAWNALLKTLEEPPAHVVFLFATTALHKVPDTIISRCQRFDLTRFPLHGITTKLSQIAKSEKFKISDGALEMIALSAEGGMRDAESLLMQITSLGITPITEAVVSEVLGTTQKQTAAQFVHLIAQHDIAGSFSLIRTLAQSGIDLSLFATLLLHFLRDLLLVSTNPKEGLDILTDITKEQGQALSELSQMFPLQRIVTLLERFQEAQIASKTATIPELPLEIAVVKILTSDHAAPPGSHPPTSPALPLPKKDETKTATQTETKASSPVVSDMTPLAADMPATSSFSLTHIRERWSAILEAAKHLNASLSLGLSTARPIETTGSTIVIAVKYPFHKERLEENANRLTLQKAFDTILETKTTLVITVDDGKSSSSDLIRDNDPLVSEALSMLGGRVVTES